MAGDSTSTHYICRGLGFTAGPPSEGWSLILGLPCGLPSCEGSPVSLVFAWGSCCRWRGIGLHPLILFAACAGIGAYCAWKNVQLSGHPDACPRGHPRWHSLPSGSLHRLVFSITVTLDCGPIRYQQPAMGRTSAWAWSLAIFRLVGFDVRLPALAMRPVIP